jgi:hypothetical protein
MVVQYVRCKNKLIIKDRRKWHIIHHQDKDIVQVVQTTVQLNIIAKRVLVLRGAALDVHIVTIVGVKWD